MKYPDAPPLKAYMERLARGLFCLILWYTPFVGVMRLDSVLLSSTFWSAYSLDRFCSRLPSVRWYFTAQLSTLAKDLKSTFSVSRVVCTRSYAHTPWMRRWSKPCATVSSKGFGERSTNGTLLDRAGALWYMSERCTVRWSFTGSCSGVCRPPQPWRESVPARWISTGDVVDLTWRGVLLCTVCPALRQLRLETRIGIEFFSRNSSTAGPWGSDV